MKPSPGSLLLAFALAALTASVRAEVTPAPLFTDQAVLQRDRPVPIWGTADVGEKVTVTFGEQRREATGGYDGRWIVFLDPLPGSNAGTDLIIAGKNTVTLHDVVVGEVWICSGQSNMEFPVQRSANAAQEIAAANFPLLREIHIERTVAEKPADTVKTSGWRAATPTTVGTFTAVGYYFARDLVQKLNLPVGIVHSSWGGTPVESWMSPAALAAPEFAVVSERWTKHLAELPEKTAEYERQLAAWNTIDAEAKAAATRAPVTAASARGKPPLRADPALVYAEWLRQHPKPRPPRGPGDPWTPASLFNGMINPLLPYAIRGALWYQGESNAERAAEYHALFAAMITAWRAHWGQGDFPFFWVNLANYAVPSDHGENGRSYAFLREAQSNTLVLPNTGQALAIDVGDPNDIHPTNKQEVGRRLALLARNRVYGITGDDAGPVCVGAARDGNGMRLRFINASGGLVAHEKPIQALELAGADRVFRPAEGRIERDTVFVSSPLVRDPVAVRYAWTNAPEANLYNGAGLPATPYRSDEW